MKKLRLTQTQPYYETSWVMLNHMSDWTEKEYDSILGIYLDDEVYGQQTKSMDFEYTPEDLRKLNYKKISESIDWRLVKNGTKSYTYVSPVKD